MSAPVWTLSVDLQTKTATFQSGMSDAARAARGSFDEIKSGANDMARTTSGSMSEARHGVMLLGEEFGVHLPRGLTMFISSLGPVAGAMEAAFPFLAIIVGATMLLEHLEKMKQAGAALTESQINFGTTTANVLNALNDKLLEAGIRADELNGKHFAALQKQLELIDHQSLNELAQSFNAVAKAADLTFAQLKTSWYQFGAGAAGAKASLESFKAQYDSLLSQGKEKEANDLLDAKIEREKQILTLQQQANASQADPAKGQHGDYAKYEEAKIALQKVGVGFTEKEVQAEQALVAALQAQVEAQKTVAGTNATDKSVAKLEEAKKAAGDAHKLADANKEVAADTIKAMDATLAFGRSLREMHKEAGDKTALTETLHSFAEQVTSARFAAQATLEASKEAGSARMENLKASTDVEKEMLKMQADYGIKSEMEVAREVIAIDKRVALAKIASINETANASVEALQKEIDAANRAGSNQADLGVKKGDTGYVDYQQTVINLKQQQDAITQKAGADERIVSAQAVQGTMAQVEAMDKLRSGWLTYFGEMKKNTHDLASTIRGELQSSIQHATDTLSSGVAKSIVEGKTLGSTMTSVARQISESMIEGLIKWGVQDLLTKMGMKATAASLAGANATASMAGAPWPVDMGAPAFGDSL